MANLIDRNEEYTFSDYVKINAEVGDIIAEFGYSHLKRAIKFPSIKKELPEQYQQELQTLKQRLQLRLEKFYFSAEIARREVYVAPVLFLLADWIDFILRIEYNIYVDRSLKGTLDYLLISPNGTVAIIEAKRDDLQKRLTQVIIQAIAYSRLTKCDGVIYAVVTTGNIWQFARVNPQDKIAVEDIRVFSLPDQIELITERLINILI